MDVSAQQLFLCGDTLVLVSSFASGGNELDQERSARVQLYDLTDPKSPTLTNEFIQLGDIVACYTSGSTLSLLTTDGVCACGWSRLDDVSEYIPQTSKNSKPVVWEDAEICILGAPPACSMWRQL